MILYLIKLKETGLYILEHDSDTVKTWFENHNPKEVGICKKKYLNLKNENEYIKDFIKICLGFCC